MDLAKYQNKVTILMQSCSANEAFARTAAAAFIAPLDPTLDILNDVKTAVSEAVTNAIIHGYDDQVQGEENQIALTMALDEEELTITVTDRGAGIKDVAKAMEPMYTTKPEMERSGMGFTVIESFMDTVAVTSSPEEGTTVVMTKKL